MANVYTHYGGNIGEFEGTTEDISQKTLSSPYASLNEADKGTIMAVSK